MGLEQLYNRRYTERGWVDRRSFKRLRKWLVRWDVQRVDDAMRLLGGVSGGVLLEIGCSHGALLRALCSRFHEARGIDVSDAIIARAKARCADHANVHVEVGNIDHGLACETRSVDVVVTLACLEHVVDLFGALREINRVLKSGGVFVSQVPNVAYIRHRISHLLGRQPITASPHNWEMEGWDNGHLHLFTHHTYRRALEYSGFEVVRMSGCGFMAPLRRWWPQLLLGDIAMKAVKVRELEGRPPFVLS